MSYNTCTKDQVTKRKMSISLKWFNCSLMQQQTSKQYQSVDIARDTYATRERENELGIKFVRPKTCCDKWTGRDSAQSTEHSLPTQLLLMSKRQKKLEHLTYSMWKKEKLNMAS